MLIRSLILVTLFAAAGPLLAADSDGPLARDRGKFRPLVIIAPSTVDPTLVNLKKSLDEPANRKAFTERNMVLYTVINTIGQRDGKDLEPQTTMALIRELKLGASSDRTKIILVGKDGEKKIERPDLVDAKELFSAIDQMPPSEKEYVVPPPPEPEVKPGAASKAAKPKPMKPPKPLDD